MGGGRCSWAHSAAQLRLRGLFGSLKPGALHGSGFTFWESPKPTVVVPTFWESPKPTVFGVWGLGLRIWGFGFRIRCYYSQGAIKQNLLCFFGYPGCRQGSRFRASRGPGPRCSARRGIPMGMTQARFRV